MNSIRSQIVDLSDASLEPAGWNDLQKPPLPNPEDISLYELHIRDFSVNDPTVPDEYKGTFKAFTLPNSNGMQHLQALQQAAQSLEHGRTQLTASGAGELLAEDLRHAQQAIGEITGTFSSDELLGRIFSSFCIGK